MVFSVSLRLHHVLPIPPPRPEHQHWTSWCIVWTKQRAENQSGFSLFTHKSRKTSPSSQFAHSPSLQWFSVTSDPPGPAPPRPGTPTPPLYLSHCVSLSSPLTGFRLPVLLCCVCSTVTWGQQPPRRTMAFPVFWSYTHKKSELPFCHKSKPLFSRNFPVGTVAKFGGCYSV